MNARTSALQIHTPRSTTIPKMPKPTSFISQQRALPRSGTGAWFHREQAAGSRNPLQPLDATTHEPSDSHAHGIPSPAYLQQAVGLCVAIILNLLASAEMAGVFGSTSSWISTAVPAALMGAIAGLLVSGTGMRTRKSLPILLVGQCVIGPTIALRDTAALGFIPTWRTITEGLKSAIGSFTYVLALPVPIDIRDGGLATQCLMALWTPMLWCTFFSATAALTAARCRNALLCVPVGVNLAIAAYLGTVRNGVEDITLIIRGAAIALTFVLWLSWSNHASGRNHVWNRHDWLIIAITCLCAGAIAFPACYAFPRDRMVGRERYEPPSIALNQTSPLSGMRWYIRNHKDDVVLIVQGLSSHVPIRMAVMDRFDGNVWNLSDTIVAGSSSDFRLIGTTANTPRQQGARVTATFTVAVDLPDQWLPTAGIVTGIALPGKASAAHATGKSADDQQDAYAVRDVYYNQSTQTATLSEPLWAENSYVVSATMPADVPQARISAAKPAQTAGAVMPTDHIPESASAMARSLTAGIDGGQAAQALVQGLRDNGWFSHGMGGEYPSAPGHGHHRIDQLLSGKAMVGDSEQYASAMALMARAIGLRSRVVLGFRAKSHQDQDPTATQPLMPEGAESNRQPPIRSESPSSTHKQLFTGNDIEAWVEIELSGLGWVAFYPTPEESKVPNEDVISAPPNPHTLRRQPPPPLTDPLGDERMEHTGSVTGGRNAEASEPDSVVHPMRRIMTRIALYGLPAWLMLMAGVSIMLANALQLAGLRRRGPPGKRAESAWDSVCLLAWRIGICQAGPKSMSTRRMQAAALDAEFAPSERTALKRLCDQADKAAFSGLTTTEETAQDCWRDADRLRSALLSHHTLTKRLIAGLTFQRIPSASGAAYLAFARARYSPSACQYPFRRLVARQAAKSIAAASP
ncbi:MAG: transglutaminase-like domain-containing protein [Bifidobacterium sp.]|jgi:transglutaminase-like putative cysteine protease|nr:transglutaminase-like domain-containing protein [Bifidobacterium sp.]